MVRPEMVLVASMEAVPPFSVPVALNALLNVSVGRSLATTPPLSTVVTGSPAV